MRTPPNYIQYILQISVEALNVTRDAKISEIEKRRVWVHLP
jgi:hypothetical protein